MIFKTVNKATLTSLVSDIYYYDGKAKQSKLLYVVPMLKTTSHNIWPFVFDMKTHSKTPSKWIIKMGKMTRVWTFIKDLESIYCILFCKLEIFFKNNNNFRMLNILKFIILSSCSIKVEFVCNRQKTIFVYFFQNAVGRARHLRNGHPSPRHKIALF